jgi:hypothetical protein
MTDPNFWKIIAVLGIGLLLVIAVLLALNLIRKRPDRTPKRQLLLAERDVLDETYTTRWKWPTSEEEEPVESENT